MGMVDKVARKLDEGEARTADVSVNKPVYKLSEIDDIAYIHDSSVLCKVKPTWIVYQEAFEQNGRLYLRGACILLILLLLLLLHVFLFFAVFCV